MPCSSKRHLEIFVSDYLSVISKLQCPWIYVVCMRLFCEFYLENQQTYLIFCSGHHSLIYGQICKQNTKQKAPSCNVEKIIIRNQITSIDLNNIYFSQNTFTNQKVHTTNIQEQRVHTTNIREQKVHTRSSRDRSLFRNSLMFIRKHIYGNI